MKKTALAFLVATATLSAFCQQQLNLDFEVIHNGKPTGWTIFGSPNYVASLDSTVVKNGKYAVEIIHKEGDANFSAWSFTLPNNYAGSRIKLTGYIKTENVTDGYAGLWMRIDPSIAFDNMSGRGIGGTAGWQKVEINLEMRPDKTEQIVLGGLLAGKGKMWLDDLQVTVDGKDVKDLKPYARKAFPAQLDKAFDKGSRIETISRDDSTIRNLNVLGLVWGFLKYYHPTVAAGKVNWDFELFRTLPGVLAAKGNNERDALLLGWIKRLGDFRETSEKDVKESKVKIAPDLGWIKSEGLSDELTSELLKVKNAFRSDNHYYVGLIKGVGNPEFKNENAYSTMKYPDAGYRLLALCRYWNIIQYYFPYKNLIEEDWKSVLKEFIPKFISAANEKEYTVAVLELISRVHDTHANIWGDNPALAEIWGRNSAPVELSIVENKAVVTGFYDDSLGKETGLQKGDVLASINGSTIADIIKGQLRLTAASNYPTQLRDIAKRLLRTNDTTIAIEFIREDKKESKILNTYARQRFNFYRAYDKIDTCFKLLDDSIAYINNGTLKGRYLPELWKQVQNCKGLIIDNRNYPSEFVIFQLSNYLMPKATPFVKFSNGSIRTPGLFTYTMPIKAGKENKQPFNGKVIILVNEVTQSSAEYHAMAYRVFPGATVIGSTTAGADGNVSSFALPGGIRTMISGIGVYYPDGKETQRVGIVPDIEVKPTIKGMMQGRDEPLEKAVQLIKERKAF